MISILKMQLFTRYYDSPLGILEISGTDSYLTSVGFQDAVKKASPKLPITEKTGQPIEDCILQLNEYFAGTRQKFDLPIRHEGTVFQQTVWKALETIPFGMTNSYIGLARLIGNEKSVRAVGTTNGNNRFAIIVPCHRVIGSNGHLVGYAGDIWRKEFLLEHERKTKAISD
jgi:methylated-DNA-[protein]-cysteine S-methyltransferase